RESVSTTSDQARADDWGNSRIVSNGVSTALHQSARNRTAAPFAGVDSSPTSGGKIQQRAASDRGPFAWVVPTVCPSVRQLSRDRKKTRGARFGSPSQGGRLVKIVKLAAGNRWPGFALLAP